MTRKGRTVVIVSVRMIITVLFVPAISVKLQRPAFWAHLFTIWGYPPWGAIAVSAAEIIGLIALWTPLAGIATIVLMTTLTGATVTWLIHGPRVAAAYPGTIVVLVAALEIYRRRTHHHLGTRQPESIRSEV
jgi:hypothetical protein